MLGGNLDDRRIAGILPQLVKVAEVVTGSIEEKAEHLHEEVRQRDTFAAFPQPAELHEQQRNDVKAESKFRPDQQPVSTKSQAAP